MVLRPADWPWVAVTPTCALSSSSPDAAGVSARRVTQQPSNAVRRLPQDIMRDATVLLVSLVIAGGIVFGSGAWAHSAFPFFHANLYHVDLGVLVHSSRLLASSNSVTGLAIVNSLLSWRSIGPFTRIS